MVDRIIGQGLSGKERKHNIIKLGEMIIALAFIIAGIVLMNTIMSDKKVAAILGSIILVEGLLNVYSAIMRDSNDYFKLNLVFGILYVVVAILLFTNLIKFVSYIQVYFAAYFVITGIKQLLVSIKLKLMGDKAFLITLIMALMIIVMGGLMVFYTFETFGIIETIAIFAILLGLLNLNTCNLLKNRVEDIIE